MLEHSEEMVRLLMKPINSSPIHAALHSNSSLPEPSHIPDHLGNNLEVAILIIVATIGMIGNFGIIIVVMLLTSLRRASNAFLVHHSVLDLLKSAYCVPFAHTMIGNDMPQFCGSLGASYIVFVTASAFNLLGMVMNEAYQFADLTIGIKDSRNYCCVIFGVFIIWFSSIIMNLGVAFIPANPSFDREMGHCIFVYGVTRNYVLHLLWIVLITLALVLTSVYLRMLHTDIKRSSYYRMATLLRATMTIDTSARTATQRRKSEVKTKHHVKHLQRVTMHKLYLLILMTAMFTAFWYPVFIVTASDPLFSVSPSIYKALTIFAWSNPTLTPFVHFLFIKTACCCREQDPEMPPTPILEPAGEEEVMPSCSRSPRPAQEMASWDLTAASSHDSSPQYKNKRPKPASLWI